LRVFCKHHINADRYGGVVKKLNLFDEFPTSVRERQFYRGNNSRFVSAEFQGESCVFVSDFPGLSNNTNTVVDSLSGLLNTFECMGTDIDRVGIPFGVNEGTVAEFTQEYFYIGVDVILNR
jgi:hypothetical protein